MGVICSGEWCNFREVWWSSNDNCLYATKAESGENRILEDFFFLGKLTCLN